VSTESRITAVWEDPSGLNYETDYAYDTLDNLTEVTKMGGAASSSWRTRTFTYDSLSRLKCAVNPEVTSSVNTPASCPASDTGTDTPGTTGFTYDADCNVQTKTPPVPPSPPAPPGPPPILPVSCRSF
jgi:YD repeat-containing protein